MRRFPQPGCQTVVASRGDVRANRTGKTATALFQASGVWLQEFLALGPWFMLAGRRWSPRPRRPPLFSYTYLLLAFASLVSVSGGVYSPMGWQQYSRPLWLSRGNHYILYLKAMTAQMRVWWTGFPQLRPSRARLHGELHCLDRVVHCSMSISAGPDLLFRLTQDFRPWLLSVAPFGAGAWWCSLCSSTQSVRLTRRSDSSDLRTCTSNRFGLAVLGARTRRPGCVSTAMCLRSFALLRGADARPPQAMD
jgi:hypothetical protein